MFSISRHLEIAIKVICDSARPLFKLDPALAPRPRPFTLKQRSSLMPEATEQPDAERADNVRLGTNNAPSPSLAHIADSSWSAEAQNYVPPRHPSAGIDKRQHVICREHELRSDDVLNSCRIKRSLAHP